MKHGNPNDVFVSGGSGTLRGYGHTNSEFKDQIMREFGERLRAAREKAGYPDAKSFAEALGVEPPAYRYWERGGAQPDLVMVARICRLLNVDANYLLPSATRNPKMGKGATAA